MSSSFKRKVLYLGGFDPRGVRFYHQLYREQLLRYAALSGDEVEVSPRSQPAEHVASWQVCNRTQDSTTDYEFLRWEDIVNDRWERNPFRLAMLVARTYGALLRDVDWAKAKVIAKGPKITVFYPLILSVLVPLTMLALMVAIAAPFLPGWAAWTVALAASALLSIKLLRLIKAPWLLRFFAFNHALTAKRFDPDLDARLDLFARRLADAIDGPWDEVLFITHSNGAILALPLLQRLLEKRPAEPALPARFAFLSLGQSIPLLALRKPDNAVKAALRFLAARDLRWVDIGSPPDGAGVFGVDCYALADAKPLRAPQMLSPRFHLFYDAKTYHKGLHNKYEIHFDYLRVGDRLSPIDYISLTASNRTLDASLLLFKGVR